MGRWDYEVIALTHGTLGWHKGEINRKHLEKVLDEKGREASTSSTSGSTRSCTSRRTATSSSSNAGWRTADRLSRARCPGTVATRPEIRAPQTRQRRVHAPTRTAATRHVGCLQQCIIMSGGGDMGSSPSLLM